MNFLLYIQWDINPDIFTIPFLDHPVRWYGFSWAVGFLVSQYLMTYIYKKEGRLEKEVDLMTLYIVLGTLLGARLGHVLFYDPVYYFQHPLSILAIWEGGLASHGGGIGIFLSAYLFTRKTQVSYLWFLDRLVIPAAFMGALIRLGNLMNSEMIGIPTDVPWAFIFTAIDDVPRHPAQLYEALYCLVLFCMAVFYWKRNIGKVGEGFMLGWFLILLFTLRFFDEFLKVNQVEFEDSMIFNMGQLLSIPYILIGIVLVVRSSRKKELSAKS